MRKYLAGLFLVSLSVLPIRAQFTTTPVIGLEVPVAGASNWNVPIAYDLNRLDTLMTITTGSGDLCGTYPAPFVCSLHGTTVPVNSAANQILLTTAIATGQWATIVDCQDTGGNHINYNATTHVFSCGTTGGAGGGGGGPITINGVSGTTFTFPNVATTGCMTSTVYNSGANTDTVNVSITGRTVTSGTTDSITQADCTGPVIYNSTTNITAQIAQAGTNITNGTEFTVVNRNTGTVTLQPATSLINGNPTYTVGPGSASSPNSVRFFADSGNFSILAVNSSSTTPIVLDDPAGHALMTTTTGAGAGADTLQWSDNNAAGGGLAATMALFGLSAADADVRLVFIPKGGGEFGVSTMYSTKIATVASAATIAPTTGVVHVNGTAAISTITPIVGCTTNTWSCVLRIIPDAAFTFTTGGNLFWAPTVTIGHMLTFAYDPGTTKWYSSN